MCVCVCVCEGVCARVGSGYRHSRTSYNGALSFRIPLEPVLFVIESSSVKDVVVGAVSLFRSFRLWFVSCLSFTSACVFCGVVHRHLALSFILEQGAP